MSNSNKNKAWNNARFAPDNPYYKQGQRSEELVRDGIAQFPNKQMQEIEFRDTLLPPIIAGNEFSPHPTWPNAWLDVVGSVHAQLDIFRGDEFLFTTPPLYREVEATINRTDNNDGTTTDTAYALNSWGNLAADFYTDQFPARVTSKMMDKIYENGFKSSVLSHLKAWDKVFQHYGLDYREIRSELHFRNTGERVSLDFFGPLFDHTDDEEISGNLITSSESVEKDELIIDTGGDLEDY